MTIKMILPWHHKCKEINSLLVITLGQVLVTKFSFKKEGYVNNTCGVAN